MMSKQKLFISLIIILLLSLMGISLWLYEIIEIKGWLGLSWVRGIFYSPFVGTLLAVFAFLTPFIISKQITIKKIFISSIILGIVNIICYKMGKILCNFLYCRFCMTSTGSYFIILAIAFSTFVFISLAYWFVTKKLIKDNKLINLLYLFLMVMLIIPLSLITINLNTGFGTGNTWIDTVKMGYPVFWTIMVLGISGIVIASQKKYYIIQ